MYTTPMAPSLPSLSDQAEFFARPFLAKSFTWTFAATNGSFSPFSYLASNTDFLARLRGYTGFRADAVCRITVAGSPFHMGRMAFATKHAGIRSSAEYNTSPGILALPHVLIDPSSDSSVEFVVPYMSPNPYFSLQNQVATSYNTFTNHVKVYYADIVGLSATNVVSASTLAVTVNVFIYYTNVAFYGKIGTAPTLTGRRFRATRDDIEKEAATGPISRVSSAIATASGALAVIPEFAPFALGVGTVATAIKDVATFFGLSKPNVPPDVNYVRTLAGAPMSVTNCQDSSIILAADANQRATTDPQDSGFGPMDQMSFAYIKKQWGYLGLRNFTDLSLAGDVIASLPVNLYVGDATATGRVVPPITHLAAPFGYWRGSLEYRFIFVTSPMIKCRVQFRHVPAVASLTSYTNSIEDKCVYELSNVNTVDITVPYTSPLEWMKVPALSNSNVWSTPATTNANGSLYVEVLNPPNSNSGSAYTIYALVYVRGGDDFEVNDFGGSSAIRCSQTVSIGLNFSNMLTGRVGLALNRENTLEKVASLPVKCTLGTPTLDSSHTSRITYGESVQHLRLLLKRYCKYITYNMSSGILTTRWSQLSIPFMLIPPSSVNTTTYFYSPLHWYSAAYFGIKGGHRYRAIPWQGNLSDTQANPYNRSDNYHCAYVWRIPALSTLFSSALPALATAAADAPSLNAWATTLTNTMQSYGGEAFSLENGQMEVTVPDTSCGRYGYSSWYAAHSTSSDAGNWRSALGVAFSIFCNQCRNAAGSAINDTFLDVWLAASDDYTLLGYYGPPIVVLV